MLDLRKILVAKFTGYQEIMGNRNEKTAVLRLMSH